MKTDIPSIEELNRLVDVCTAFKTWDAFRRAMQPEGYDQVYVPTLRTDVGQNTPQVRRLRLATQALGFRVWPADGVM